MASPRLIGMTEADGEVRRKRNQLQARKEGLANQVGSGECEASTLAPPQIPGPMQGILPDEF